MTGSVHGGMHGWGACVAGSVCMVGSVCGIGGVHGGGGHEWQGGMHGTGCVARSMHGRRDFHCSSRYASCRNAFLLQDIPLRPRERVTEPCRKSTHSSVEGPGFPRHGIGTEIAL